MRARRPSVHASPSPGRLVLAALLLAPLIAAPGQAAAAPPEKATKRRAPLATCDTAPGVTVRTAERWRLFRPRPGDPLAGGAGSIWACRREPGVARHFAVLGPFLMNVHRVVGDLAEFDNGGKYTSETDVVDLGTLRFTTVAGDGVARGGSLIGSGAIVDLSFPSAAIERDDDPAAGVYTTLGEGAAAAVAFDVPTARADSSTWKRLPRDSGTSRVRRTFRTAIGSGVTVTPLLGSGVQLDARRATRRAPATLTMRCPEITAYGGYGGPHQTDRIGRLVPGSEAEARALAPTVVIGRFLDHPNELRLRVWEDGARDARIRLDLPAPASNVPHPVAVDSGVTAVAGADAITILTRDPDTGADQFASVPVAGASDLALTMTSTGRADEHVLYYRDASGALQRSLFERPREP
ncbi:MAG: hypothetical protein PGN13_01205 [Patulibacter minatonensis]